MSYLSTAQTPRRGNVRDEPIKTCAEDQLDRGSTADSIANICLTADAEDGLTVAVTGEWGSGKSSCIAMGVEKIGQSAVVIEWNPWLWANVERLVYDLLMTIATKLWKEEKKREEAARRIGDYAPIAAGLLSDVGLGGKALEKGANLIAKRLERAPQDLLEKAKKRLKQLDTRIIVLVDDTDRLDTPELLEVMRAIKLAAKLPNIVYLLALNKKTAADMIERSGRPGYSYLEKVLTWEIPVPLMQVGQRQDLTMEWLRRQLRDAEAELRLNRDDQVTLRGLWTELIRTPRDVKRYAMRCANALRRLPEGVQHSDMLAVEAIRTKLPETGQLLTDYAWDLTVHEGMGVDWLGGVGPEEDKADKKASEKLLEAAGRDGKAVRRFIRAYLPRAEAALRGGNDDWTTKIRQFRLTGRIAELSVLEAVLGSRTPRELEVAQRGEQVRQALRDREELARTLEALPKDLRFSVLDAADESRREFTEGDAKGLPALLEWEGGYDHRTAEGTGGPDMGIVVLRMVRRLLESIPKEKRAFEARHLIGETQNAAGKSLLIYMLEYKGEYEGQMEPLVSKEEVERFNFSWVEDIQEMTEDEAMALPGGLLEVARRRAIWGPRTRLQLPVWGSPGFTRKLLVDAMREGSRTSMRTDGYTDETTVQKTLIWDSVVQVWGSEEKTMEAVEAAWVAEPRTTAEEEEAIEAAYERFAGRRETIFDEIGLPEARLGLDRETWERVRGVAEKRSASEEETCRRALQRGHGASREAREAREARDLGRGSRREDAVVTSKVYAQQEKWAKEKAAEEKKDLEQVWREVLELGLSRLER